MHSMSPFACLLVSDSAITGHYNISYVEYHSRQEVTLLFLK